MSMMFWLKVSCIFGLATGGLGVLNGMGRCRGLTFTPDLPEDYSILKYCEENYKGFEVKKFPDILNNKYIKEYFVFSEPNDSTGTCDTTINTKYCNSSVRTVIETYTDVSGHPGLIKLDVFEPFKAELYLQVIHWEVDK